MKSAPAFRSIALLFSLALGLSTASGQRYQVTDLGVVPGQQLSRSAAINQQGQVAGSSQSFASRYTNGVQESLGTLPGGTSSAGLAINNLGAVAGHSTYQNGGSIRQAALFQNGTVIDLGVLPAGGSSSYGLGINDKNEVVGYSTPNPSSIVSHRAFVWDASNGMRDLGFGIATSINNSSVVTGYTASGGFLWDAVNGMRIFSPVSTGEFINDRGHVTGPTTIEFNEFENRTHAFLYDGTTVKDLGSLGGDHAFTDYSRGFCVNNRDEVVGTTYRPYQGGARFQIAFVYRAGQMFDLEQLVDETGKDYRLYSATAINDAGQIAVDAIKISTNEVRAVLLTPIPEVTSISRLSEGRIRLQGRGIPNQSYRVESSPEAGPGSFRNAGSIVAGLDGAFQFEEVPANGMTALFYRLVRP